MTTLCARSDNDDDDAEPPTPTPHDKVPRALRTGRHARATDVCAALNVFTQELDAVRTAARLPDEAGVCIVHGDAGRFGATRAQDCSV